MIEIIFEKNYNHINRAYVFKRIIRQVIQLKPKISINGENKNQMVGTGIGIFFLLLLLFSAGGYKLYLGIEKLIVDELGKNATNVAVTVSNVIEQDIEPYIELVNVEDYSKDYYDKEYYNKMRNLFKNIKNEGKVTFIFTQKKISKDTVAYIIDGENEYSQWFSPIGSTDSMGVVESKVFNEGITAATGIVEWEFWGKFLTGYAPIVDKRTGDVVGLVGVDFSVDYINGLLKGLRTGIIISVIFLSFFIALVLHKLLRDRLLALNIDYMTGFFSKRYYDIKISELIDKSYITGNPLSLMMIDVDFFKQVNDRYGHDIGDRILKATTKEIKRRVRETDICARYGGDEFVIILPDTNLENAEIIGNRILNEFNYNVCNVRDMEIKDIDITLSIGIAIWKEGLSGDELTQIADEAMYKAKKRGRNRVVINP